MNSKNSQIVNANGTQIAYEIHGNKDAPVILLIHGLGMPMAAWPMAVVNKLVDKGFQVLLFDNRDQGHSQRFDHLKVPNMLWQFIKLRIGLPITSPYALTDLMSDTLGLINALNIKTVHVVGISMGGMIAQLLALQEPDRVKSLTSIMSTTGNKKIPGPTKKVAAHLVNKPKMKSKEDVVAYHIKTWELIGSPDYPTSQQNIKAFVLNLMDRGMSAAGTARQMLAILSAPSRSKALSRLKMPVQVIHGLNDPLVRVEGGIDTAASIAHAQEHLIEGMGHDLPEQLHDRICELICRQASEVENATKQAAS
jgi:pimeloyl-ACP methyl ester carboxylesterase